KYQVQGKQINEGEYFERELSISKEVSDSGISIEGWQVSPKVFRMGVVPANGISQNWLTEVSRFCEEIVVKLKDQQDATLRMYFLEMESCYPGDLWSYILDQTINGGTAFSLLSIKGLTFHVCQAMYVLQRQLGLKHFDLKCSNVLLK